MASRVTRRRTSRRAVLRPPARVRRTVAAIAARACRGGGGGGDAPQVPNPAACESGTSYDSTFAAAQAQIFERHGCTQQVCHGSSAQGGLDLSPDATAA